MLPATREVSTLWIWQRLWAGTLGNGSDEAPGWASRPQPCVPLRCRCRQARHRPVQRPQMKRSRTAHIPKRANAGGLGLARQSRAAGHKAERRALSLRPHRAHAGPAGPAGAGAVVRPGAFPQARGRPSCLRLCRGTAARVVRTARALLLDALPTRPAGTCHPGARGFGARCAGPVGKPLRSLARSLPGRNPRRALFSIALPARFQDKRPSLLMLQGNTLLPF